jgi:hypothetical protein
MNQTSDIEGAQGGSLKKGTTTNRNTSPLNPQYQFPGHTELIDPSNAFSKSKSDFRGSRSFAPGTTSGSIHATTGLEALKRQTGGLEVIPEGRAPELDVNKLYQASRGPTAASSTVAVLTEKRLKEHDVTAKSQVKFTGVSSTAASSVQKFDGFISKA